MTKERNQRSGRFDGFLHPHLLALLAERAGPDRSVNEVLNEVLARGLGLDPDAYRVPRRAPGRPRTAGVEKKSKKKIK